MLKISGDSLTIEDVVAVANGMTVTLDDETLPKIERSRAAVDQLIANNIVAYGITTGFGRLRDRIIPPDKVKQLQLNLVRSHAAGVGKELDEKTVRAMMIVRANTLALGYSGVRPVVIQTLLDMLNRGIYPCIPCQGSLGASGDLPPLAHLTMSLIGEGDAMIDGERLPSAEALASANITPLELQAKEGLALINGTSLMVGLGARLLDRAINLIFVADVAAAMTLEAHYGTDRAFDPRAHAIRPHPGQIECAAFIRALIADSQFLRPHTDTNIQDPYTLRCIPQVHGAVRDALNYAKQCIDIELNAVNDNPLILVDVDEAGHETIDVISAGNFHGEPIAIPMDSLKIAITDLGNMSERRTARLMDADSNSGVLPMFLSNNSGLENGLMMAHYTATALTCENKVLVHPASADSLPGGANYEDHVSLGTIAARQLEQIIEHVENIVAIELISAAQGIDYRCQKMGITTTQMGAGTRQAYDLLRTKVPFLETDKYIAPLIAETHQLITSGAIKEAVEAVCLSR